VLLYSWNFSKLTDLNPMNLKLVFCKSRRYTVSQWTELGTRTYNPYHDERFAI